MHYILKNGKIVSATMMEWAAWFEENNETRIIDRTSINENVYVSTVFLGLDHGFGRSELPILFETMIFGGEQNEFQRRYATQGDAKRGHWTIVYCLRNNLPIPEDVLSYDIPLTESLDDDSST